MLFAPVEGGICILDTLGEHYFYDRLQRWVHLICEYYVIIQFRYDNSVIQSETFSRKE